MHNLGNIFVGIGVFIICGFDLLYIKKLKNDFWFWLWFISGVIIGLVNIYYGIFGF